MKANEKQYKSFFTLILSLLLIISSVNSSLALKSKSTKVKTNGKKIVKTIKRKDKTSKVKVKSNPSIRLTTKFPTGTVEDNRIDVEYTAIPSKGAEITEVSYTINDSTFNYIYLKGGGIIEPKGTLGKGKVLLLPKENTIVFKVVDSSGKSATFTVKEKPKFDYGIPTPGFGDDEKSDFADPSKGKFVNNRIIVYLKNNANKQQIQELVEYVDGTIIGKNNVVNKIVIKIPKKTEEEINALCKELEVKYADIVDHVSLETFGLIGPISITPPTNDTWWN